jgi:hypothetical protein
MIVCPLCEHPQAQGTTCEQCGQQWGTPASAVPAAPPIPELESTAWSTEPVPVGVERMPELELTAFRPTGAASSESVPDLERTRAEPVQAAPAEPVPHMETGRAEDDGVRTAAPGDSLTCRYCRTVQRAQALCERCGMRLPRVSVAKGPVQAASEGVWTRCRKCGARARAGGPCSSCGVPVPSDAS